MSRSLPSSLLSLSRLRSSLCSAALAQGPDYARDPHQAIDESYTAAIRKYTTAPEFNSPLTDYLPASKSSAHARQKFSATSPARRTSCPMRKMSTNTFASSRLPRHVYASSLSAIRKKAAR